MLRRLSPTKLKMSCCYASTVAGSDALYLGLDSSTQGLKATAITKDFQIVHSFAINYQKDLPHYSLVNGVHASAGNVVTQPTLMVRFLVLLRCVLPPSTQPHPPHPPHPKPHWLGSI